MYSQTSLRDGSGLDPSRAMNVLCWNCQGMGNSWTVQGLKGIISLNLPSFIFVSETRCSVDEMTNIRRQIGFRNVFAVPCKFGNKKGGKGITRAGGLALFWNEGTHVSLNSFSHNHIDVRIGEVSDPKR